MKLRKRKVRLVRYGDTFTDSDLVSGHVELLTVEPNPDPPLEADRKETWAFGEHDAD
jgi:hypothetical protein